MKLVSPKDKKLLMRFIKQCFKEVSMSNIITSTKMFAYEFRDFISDNALNGKELKSIAKVINYRLSVIKPLNRVKLTNELVNLNAFLGSITIKQCFSQSEFTSKTIDEIIEKFVNALLLQWIPESFNPIDYFQNNRMNIWVKLLRNLDSTDQVMKDMSDLSESFYHNLTNKQCTINYSSLLAIRFNRYVLIYADYIQQMIDKFELFEQKIGK